MKKLLNKYIWSRIVLGVLIAALGIILIVVSANNNNSSDITKLICIIFGAYIAVLSAIALIISFVIEGKKKTVINNLAFSIVLGFGLVFVIFADKYAVSLQTVVQYLVPMVLMTVGGVFLVQSVIEIVTKSVIKNWVPRIVIGGIFVTLGIILIINVEDVIKWIYIVLGAIIVISGIVELVFGIIFAKNAKKAFKDIDEEQKAQEEKPVELIDMTKEDK